MAKLWAWASAVGWSAAASRFDCSLMTPREPVSRVFRHGRGVSLQRHGVIERVERASVDQAQVDVPVPRSVERFIASEFLQWRMAVLSARSVMLLSRGAPGTGRNRVRRSYRLSM